MEGTGSGRGPIQQLRYTRTLVSSSGQSYVKGASQGRLGITRSLDVDKTPCNVMYEANSPIKQEPREQTGAESVVGGVRRSGDWIVIRAAHCKYGVSDDVSMSWDISGHWGVNMTCKYPCITIQFAIYYFLDCFVGVCEVRNSADPWSQDAP